MNDGNDKNPCEPFRILMMGHIDGELGPEDEARFLEHVRACPECGKELTEYRKLAEMTDALKLKEPADFEWERIRRSLMYRIENRAGWLMVIAGLAVVLGWFLYELLLDWEIASCLRVGIVMFIVGFTLLLLSALKSRLRIKKFERYEAVER